MTQLDQRCADFKATRAEKKPSQKSWQGCKQRESRAKVARQNGLFDPGAEQCWYFPGFKKQVEL